MMPMYLSPTVPKSSNLLQDSDFAAYTVSELRDANDRVSDLIQQARRLADDSAANAIDGAQLWAQRSFAGAGEGTAADLPARSALAHLEIDLYQRYAASELQIVQTLGARTPGLEQRLQTGQALLARLNQAIRDYDEEQRDIMGLDLVRDILRGGVPDDSRSSQHPHLEMGHQPREESSEHEEEDSDEKRDVEDTIR